MRKKERGFIRAFLSRVTRLSPAHLTRLIRQYRRAGTLPSQSKTRRCFPTTYTPEDVALVAETDRLHQRLSGPATRCLFERAWKQFGDIKFERLAQISVSHLYNLRRHYPQAHAVGTYSQRARRVGAQILHRAFQSLPELPPAVWLRHRHRGCAGKRQRVYKTRALRHTIRKTEVAAAL